MVTNSSSAPPAAGLHSVISKTSSSSPTPQPSVSRPYPSWRSCSPLF